MQLKWKWLILLACRWYTVHVSYVYKRVGILVDVQLSVKSNSISLPDICAKSAKSHTGFTISDSNLITNVHCSGKNAFQIGEFINNMQFKSIHSDGGFAVRLSRCWLNVVPRFLC